jgi:hypothetical protein
MIDDKDYCKKCVHVIIETVKPNDATTIVQYKCTLNDQVVTGNMTCKDYIAKTA